MSSCGFQKHGNKAAGPGGEQPKLWVTNQMVVAAELKYTDVQSAAWKCNACQDAFFIIVLPSTGLLPVFLFPSPPSTSIPPLLFQPTTSTLPYPLKEYCTHSIAFHFRAVTDLRLGDLCFLFFFLNQLFVLSYYCNCFVIRRCAGLHQPRSSSTSWKAGGKTNLVSIHRISYGQCRTGDRGSDSCWMNISTDHRWISTGWKLK